MADGNGKIVGYNRRPMPLKSFDGVGFNAKAEARIDGGLLLHEIVIVASHALTEAELKIGNDSKIKLSADELKFLERYKKQWETGYHYVLSMADISNVSLMGEILSGLNTTKDMDITLYATMGAGSGTPTIRAMAAASATPAQPCPATSRWTSPSCAAAVTAESVASLSEALSCSTQTRVFIDLCPFGRAFALRRCPDP